MVKNYIYVISVLKKMEAHPLEKLAYYSGFNQVDSYEGKYYTSTTSDKVIWGDLILPDRQNDFEAYCNLPEFLKVKNKNIEIIKNIRNVLWRETAAAEKKKEYQCARIFDLSIPAFLDKNAAIESIETFGKYLMKKGMIVDASLHDFNTIQAPLSLFEQFTSIKSPIKATEPVKASKDYKAFLMCTLRDYKNGSFVAKNREWNTYESMIDWRRNWFNILEQQIDFCDVEPSSKTKWINKLNRFKEIDKSQSQKGNTLLKGFKP